MKILDEIRAYNGKLNYRELVELVTRINNRVNAQVNQGTGRIPLMYFNREKTFLNSLPADTIRKPYQITTNTVKVNHSSMFFYKECIAAKCSTFQNKIFYIKKGKPKRLPLSAGDGT